MSKKSKIFWLVGRTASQLLLLQIVTFLGSTVNGQPASTNQDSARLTAELAGRLNPATTLLAGQRHFRNANDPEWTTFAKKPDGPSLEIDFDSTENKDEWTLQLTHIDVREIWDVTLNGHNLGRLERDENPMTVYFAVPAKTVVTGKNRLQISQPTKNTIPNDDVLIRHVVLHRQPKGKLLSQCTLNVEVTDANTTEKLPVRITILRHLRQKDASLQEVSVVSNEKLAVRVGTIYSSQGICEFGLPDGLYTIVATRGFEYSAPRKLVRLEPGGENNIKLQIERQVDTRGYVACDTHVHSRTHSGHGDSTVEERMITLAGEGIELPIATDHNVQIDHEPFAKQLGVRKFFTPVIGNEVTTKVGHFNIFPISPGSPRPDHTSSDWGEILGNIYSTPDVKIAILNHGRDVHSGVRPLGPELFNEASGENTKDWPIKFNAMEIINSSATQYDVEQECRDWMALLNRGYKITPVGCSDSHDVLRHFVGQGRTYIRANDNDPSNINVQQAADAFVAGHVLVSYGVLVQIVTDDGKSSGDIAKGSSDWIEGMVRIQAPDWIPVDGWSLYANGTEVARGDVDWKNGLPTNVDAKFRVRNPGHDIFLAATATGPGITHSFWRTAKPYQRNSPDFTSRIFGCSGAAFVKVDEGENWNSAFDYAKNLYTDSKGDLADLLSSCTDYHPSVATQAASLYQSDIGEKGNLLTAEAQAAISKAAPHVRRGFRDFIQAWKKCQAAQ